MFFANRVLYQVSVALWGWNIPLSRDGTINSTYNHVTTLLCLDENRGGKEFNQSLYSQNKMYD